MADRPYGPETALGDVGRTANGRHWDAYTVSREGKLRPEPLVGVADRSKFDMTSVQLEARFQEREPVSDAQLNKAFRIFAFFVRRYAVQVLPDTLCLRRAR